METKKDREDRVFNFLCLYFNFISYWICLDWTFSFSLFLQGNRLFLIFTFCFMYSSSLFVEQNNLLSVDSMLSFIVE